MPLSRQLIEIDTTELNSAIATTNLEIETLSASTTASVTALDARLITTENSFTSIGSQSTAIANLQLSVNNLQTNFNGLTQTVSNIDITIRSQGENIIYLNSQRALLSERIDTLESAISAIKLPVEFQHFHDTSKVLVGGAITSAQQAASYYATMWQQTPAALNDSFSFSVLLEIGTYEFSMLTTRSNNKGDLKLSINGVLAFNDVTGYNSTQIYERITRNITITTAGLQEFIFTVYKKNASSTGYSFLVNKFAARKI